jgi:hypothetical protein
LGKETMREQSGKNVEYRSIDADGVVDRLDALTPSGATYSPHGGLIPEAGSDRALSKSGCGQIADVGISFAERMA